MIGMELRDLQKMTVVKLREEGLKHSSITGVYAMDKTQLIAALAEVYGIDIAAATRAAREQFAADKSALKQAIRTFKGQRDAALTAHDAAQVQQLRLHIKKHKRLLRRLAASQTAAV
jgi:DNA invertase Pin-like site-specific DNA recombinase